MRRAVRLALLMLMLSAPAGASQPRFVSLGDLPGGDTISVARRPRPKWPAKRPVSATAAAIGQCHSSLCYPSAKSCMV